MKYLFRTYFVLAVITSQTVASHSTNDNYDDELKKSVAFLRNIKLEAMVNAHGHTNDHCEQCSFTLESDQDEQNLGNHLLTTQPQKKSKIFSLKKTLHKLCHLHQ